MNPQRRRFVGIPLACGVGALCGAAAAQGSVVAEKEPQAAALGYVTDAKRADKAKFPKYAEGQRCANCQLYQTPSAPLAPCAIFGGRQVAGPGWCSAWVARPT